MPFEPSQAADHLASLVSDVANVPDGGWPFGCPSKELTRSPAAAAVGRLAADAGLGLFHTEWRRALALPEDWVPAHDPSLAEPPRWGGGVLPERKYQAFRHDQALGGYHPGMRAKWTAHELCHGLVGFAWTPDATPFFLATAGRLAELVPVVLWYFLDEAHLVRCPVHAGGGALHRGLCPTCEACAAARVDEVHADALLEEGRLFVEREIAAVRRSLRMGVPVPHTHGGLDLCSDGIAYAAAHGPRLRSEAFHRFAEGFLVDGGGMSTTLDALQERALAVLHAVVEGSPLEPLAPSRNHGEARWVLQDLGWRLSTLWHETDGEAAQALSAMVDELAAACALTTQDGSEDQVFVEAASALRRVRSAYGDLHAEVVLPEPDDVFALGHDLLGTASGRSVNQVVDGVIEAMPCTAHLLGAELPSAAERFIDQDRAVRVALPRRFSTWLGGESQPELGALARYEAALVGLGAADGWVVGLGGPQPGEPVRLADGVVVLTEQLDMVELARSVDFGDIVRLDDGRIQDVDGQPVPVRPTALVMLRSAQGEPVLLDVPTEVGVALLRLWDGGVLNVDEPFWNVLVEHGVLRPVSWSLASR